MKPGEVKTLPPYLTAAQVGRANGWATVTARRWLQRAKIAQKIGGEWCVGHDQLRDRLPEVYQRVFEYYVLGTSDDHRRSQTITDDHPEGA